MKAPSRERLSYPDEIVDLELIGAPEVGSYAGICSPSEVEQELCRAVDHPADNVEVMQGRDPRETAGS
jgi:hypothetical protein